MNAIFLDTNVIIDIISKREPYYNDSVAVFFTANRKNIKLYISPITYTTASYLMRKSGRDKLIQLLKMLKSITHVTTTDEKIITNAIFSEFTDFEDAVQYFCARRVKAEAIITRNTKDFLNNSAIPVFTPKEWIEANL